MSDQHPYPNRTATGHSHPNRTAYAVWAVAFSVAVLFHEWQKGAPPWTWHLVPALLAMAVLARPTCVLRMIGLFAALAVELACDLPDPWNHTLIIGLLGAAVSAWWLLLVRKDRSAAHDPGRLLDQIGPVLRTAFILAFFAAAFAKLNEGFLDPIGTCAAWIMESIPFVAIPGMLRVPLIVGTLLLELAIPALLLFRVTRPIAIVLGFVFHLISAVAGHTAFSGFAWSFYLLFLPAGMLAEVAARARATVVAFGRRVGRPASPVTWIWVGVAWLVALGLLQLLPYSTYTLVRRWGAALPYSAYMTAWAVLLWRLRSRWLRLPPGPHCVLRVRHVLFGSALGLLLLNAASPYLGLKTRYSFTMYSDLRTEPGLWNHLVVPESVRVFGLQDGSVRFREVSDPDLADRLTFRGGDRMVLLDAQRIAAEYPRATIRYEIDGQPRLAAPVSSDPVLGADLSPLLPVLGGFRPIDDRGASCQH